MSSLASIVQGLWEPRERGGVPSGTQTQKGKTPPESWEGVSAPQFGEVLLGTTPKP